MENHCSARRNDTLSGPLVKYIFRKTLVAQTISNPSAWKPSWNMVKGPPIKAWSRCRIIDPNFPTFIWAYSSFTVWRNMAGWSNYPKRSLTHRRIGSAEMQLASASYSIEHTLWEDFANCPDNNTLECKAEKWISVWLGCLIFIGVWAIFSRHLLK